MRKEVEYGYALYEIAVEDGIEKEIEHEFKQIALLFETHHDFTNLLANPRIPTSERIDVINKTFGNKIQPYLLSLIKIFTETRNVSLIPACYKEFMKKYYEDKNIMEVIVTSAVKLSDEQRSRLKGKLENVTKKTIVLDNRIDETCIGGIRLDYKGHMIDASVKNRFKILQQNIKNADYS